MSSRKTFNQDSKNLDNLNSNRYNRQRINDKPNKEKYVEPNTLSFDTTILGKKGPTIRIIYLENLKAVNFSEWLEKIKQVKALNKWSDEISIITLKMLTNHKIKKCFENETTFDDAIEKLTKVAFPLEDYRLYIAEANNLKKYKYISITDYSRDISDICTKANICLKDTKFDKISERESFEIFF